MRQRRIKRFIVLTILLILVLLLTGCHDPRYEANLIDNDRARAECSSKGGLWVGDWIEGGNCFAIDSIIPLTGEREINKVSYPHK